MQPTQVHPAALSSCVQLYDNLLHSLKEASGKRKMADVRRLIDSASLPLARQDRLDAMRTDKQLLENNWKKQKSAEC